LDGRAQNFWLSVCNDLNTEGWKTEKLDNLLQLKNGFLKTSEAMATGISRAYFREYVQKRGLERVARGLYRSMNTWDDPMFVLQVRYLDLIFSHETALYLLNLADREPDPFTVTMRAGVNATALSNAGIKVYKIKPELFEKGLVKVKSPAGNSLRSYNAERTICDLLRSRNHIEIQTLQTAVKEYLRLEEKNIPQLMRYAKAFSVEKILRSYLEVLL
jgi:hypothetical protein